MKREISFDEFRDIGLEGLRTFINICKNNGLKYYLAYGTLLGAIRHKGFIPWDDDIDIFMPRDDYEKFIRINEFENNDKWSIYNPFYLKDYCYYWTKFSRNDTIILPCRFNNGFLYGVSIDVFPIDTFKEADYMVLMDSISSLRKIYNERMWNTKINTVTSKSIKGHLNMHYRKFCYKFFSKKLEKANSVLSDAQISIERLTSSVGKYCCYPFDVYNTMWKTEWFDKAIEMEFENISCSVPAGYDQLLSEIYGNYMELPPIEKQVCNHSFHAFYLN